MASAVNERPIVIREIALWALTVGTAVGCRRLIDGWSFLTPVVITITVAHLLGAITRRARWPLPVAAVLALPTGAITLANAFYASTTTFGVPGHATWDAAGADLDLAWSTFGDIRAPAEPLTGYVVSIAATCWVVAFLADWAAFRLRSPFEAVLPSGILFVFAALFARGPYREVAAAAWLPPAIVFLLLAQIDRREATASWVTGAARRGRATLATRGAAAGVVVGALAFVMWPAVPGAESKPLVNVTDLGEGQDDTRVTISPLVQVQSRLVDLQDVLVFTVRAEQADYWRLASLDIFDGDSWSFRANYDDADGALPSTTPDDVAVTSMEQEFSIAELSTLWAPAAFEPRRIVSQIGGSLEYNAEANTLVVQDGQSTSDGMRYTVESAVPNRELAAISSAPAADPDRFARYLELPDDFSDSLIDEARRVTVGASTPYEQAIALQSYFRQFTYDAQVDQGHGIDRMEDFVFDVRAGYCEQFASTFAAMARAVGLPSRVAVGFTPGDYDPGTDLYRVSGIHAHAWPEVWLDGIGWLRFEPTPNRGAPGDEAYTGVAPAQAQGSIPESTTTTSTSVPDDRPQPTTVPNPDRETPTGPATGTETAASEGTSPWPRRLLLAALVLVVPVAGLFGLVRVRTWRRRRRAIEPAAQIDVAWAEVCEASARLDLGPEIHETPHEYADRIGHHLGTTGGRALGSLARHTVRARYAPQAPSPAEAAAAWEFRDRVVDEVDQRTARSTRAAAKLDPRRPRVRI